MLIVSRLDRLARSTCDLLNILHAIADRGAKFSRCMTLVRYLDTAGRAIGDSAGRLRHVRAPPDQGKNR